MTAGGSTESDGLGLLLCAAGVALASFSLVLDFDAIEQGIALGVPEKESWRAAFGLTVTLVWLYLELLASAGDSPAQLTSPA